MTEFDPQADRFSLTARLHHLLQDISQYLQSASEDEKRRLLSFLENWTKQRDRRKHQRRPCSLRVTFSTKDFLSRDTIKDISAGGVFLETPEPLSLGDEITMMFSPPGSKKQIDVTGKVTWAPRRGVGVKFASSPSKDLEEILASV